MNRVFWSILFVFSTVVGLIIFQATRESYAAVLLPSNLLEKGSDVSIKRVRLGAKVADTEIKYQVEPEIELRFEVEDPEDPSGSVPVIYKGLKPDMFAVGRDVIIDGEYVNGTMLASNLLTQCPSKYEPPQADDISRCQK